ncbi:MAG: hypothetical protein ABI383_05390 [Acidobacteriaceae bacterium]
MIAELEAIGFEIPAAIWVYSHEALYWRLLIATPAVDTIGPLKAYSALRKALGNNLPAIDMSLVSPNDSRVRDFRQSFHGIETEPPTQLNSLVSDSAYVYRV